MKKFLFISILIFLSSCNQSSKQAENQIVKKVKPLNKEYYFDFDKIDYYNIDVKDDDLYSILLKDIKSEKEEQFLNIITSHGIPASLRDSTFLNYIEKVGYSKIEISDKKNKEINEVFKLKKHKNGYTAACVAIFRDVMVFRKKSKIIGIAKICFGCRQYHIIGTDLDDGNFGQSGDFEKLNNILDAVKNITNK